MKNVNKVDCKQQLEPFIFFGMDVFRKVVWCSWNNQFKRMQPIITPIQTHYFTLN